MTVLGCSYINVRGDKMPALYYPEINVVNYTNNKCASRSLQNAFEKYKAIVYRPQNPLSYYLKKYPGAKIMFFVRNPWDRAISHYFYHNKHGKKNNKDFATFEDFIETKYNVSEKQFQGVCKMVSKERIDVPLSEHFFVGKFENINNDFKDFCRLINIDCELPWLNRSRKDIDRIHYSKYYTTKTKNLIHRIYKDDIETFNYIFQETE